MTDYQTGASASLNRTIGELQKFLGPNSRSLRYGGAGLRETLDHLIYLIACRAFEMGYRAAHAECAKQAEQCGAFPEKIAFVGKPNVAPKASGPIRFESKAVRTKIFKMPVFNRERSFWQQFIK